MGLNQVRDPMRDDPRFAASGTRQKQKRTCYMRDSFTLLRIESGEEIHGREYRKGGDFRIASRAGSTG